MLALTKKTDYALIAMAHLAERPNEFCSARQIARQYSLPLPVLMNILKTLHHQGLVVSTRGAKGGYRIAASPRRVSLARLIDAVEGPIRFAQCAGQTEQECAVGACPIRQPVLRLHHKLSEFLRQATLAEVLGHGPGEGAKASPPGDEAGPPPGPTRPAGRKRPGDGHNGAAASRRTPRDNRPAGRKRPGDGHKSNGGS